MFTYKPDVNIGRAGETKDTNFFWEDCTMAPPLEVMNKLIKKIAIVLELKYEVFKCYVFSNFLITI